MKINSILGYWMEIGSSFINHLWRPCGLGARGSWGSKDDPLIEITLSGPSSREMLDLLWRLSGCCFASLLIFLVIRVFLTRRKLWVWRLSKIPTVSIFEVSKMLCWLLKTINQRIFHSKKDDPACLLIFSPRILFKIKFHLFGAYRPKLFIFATIFKAFHFFFI